MALVVAETEIIASLQSEIAGLQAIYLFGSHAQGTAGPDSDIDLAVLMAGAIDTVALWEVAQRLASNFDCEVDLLDLRSASTVMQYQIITTGRLLWARDVQAALYESFILSEKTALDSARAGLLADIAREGTVYGR
jgi:predicted nucleotidyltransferase